MNLLNLTLGRDAFHPCLISLWPKEGCTHQLITLVSKNKIWAWNSLDGTPSRKTSWAVLGGRWGLPLKPQNAPFSWWLEPCTLGAPKLLCERTFVSAPNQVLFTLEWVKINLHPTRTNLINPTSGRDASHPCPISL